jgi:predicted SAM-dependent methyltransferase
MFKILFKKNKSELFKSRSKKIFDDYFLNNDVKKLQIGCGDDNLLEGWLNTDLNSKNDKVGFLDAGKRFPFRDKTFEYIYSEHMIEHLNFGQVDNMLYESFRALNKGGVIRIATPNLDFLVNLYQDPDLPLHKEYIIWATKSFIKDIAKKLNDDEYSSVFVINNFFKDWGHQIIYNFDTLKGMLERVGFCDIIKCEVSKSNNLTLNNLERHGNGIPQKFNVLETMVIEARKK